MNDLELAEEIERYLNTEAGAVRGRGYLHIGARGLLERSIAALRRGSEPVHKNETFAEKVKRLQDAHAQIDMELSELL